MINLKKSGGLSKVITPCLLVMLVSTIVRAENTSYYVDTTGSDSADGQSEKSPWKTVNRVNRATFGPGDRLLFKAGQRWGGQLKLQGSGSAQAPIRVGRYGKGKAPHIAGEEKKDATVLLQNSSHWVIEDLEVTNTIPGEKRRNRMKGVSVEANSGGVFKNIILRRLHVHHVSGDWDRHGGSGIWVGVTSDAEDGSTRKSRYDGVLIEDCYVHDVSFYAIMFSGWPNRFRDKRWFPSTNVVVRNNFTRDSGGDSIVVICCDKPLIENNEGHRAAIGQSRGGKTHAAGMWPHSCDGMVMRYNKVVGIDAKKDGQAFDVDINCRDTLIEYNWSQGNRSGFLLFCSPSLNEPGTYGITVRNNLSIDDGEQKGLFCFVSDVRDVTIQNNAFLNSFSDPHNFMNLWRPKKNKGWKTDVLFKDNLFSTPGRKVFKAESWVVPTFKGNTYAGDYQGMPADATGVATKHPAVLIEKGRVSATDKRSTFKPFDVSKAGLLPTSSWIKQRDESLKKTLAKSDSRVKGYSPTKSGYQLVYQDEFNDNSLNTNDWYYRDSLKPRLGGYNQKKNVSVTTEDGIGMLKITYTKEDLFDDGKLVPVGGGIMSTTTFGYGYYETRIKFYDKARGFHQSFWNYGLERWPGHDFRYNEDAMNDRVPWSNKAIELDGIELDSAFNTAWVNFHWHIKGPVQTKIGTKKQTRVDSYIDTNKWVVIGFEWLPDAVVYYVDGVERYRYKYNAGDPRYTPSEIWLTGLAHTAWFLGGEGSPTPGAAMRVDYFRFYTKLFDANYTGNRGMESQTKASATVRSWIADDGIYNNVDSDQVDLCISDRKETAYAGKAYMRHTGKTKARPITSRMRLDHIANGTYTFSAWAKHSGGMNECRMHVWSYGGEKISQNIPALSCWTQIKIENIKVTSHEIDLGFTTQGSDGEWLYLDEVKFYPQESAIEVAPGVGA